MKRVWTMSRDLELCVYHTMYVLKEFSTACAFSDGCPKGLRYSVKKKVVVTAENSGFKILKIISIHLIIAVLFRTLVSFSDLLRSSIFPRRPT